MKKILLTATLLFSVLGISTVFAQDVPQELRSKPMITPYGPMDCLPYDAFQKIATQQFGEYKRGMGITAAGNGIVELHYSKRGTWVFVLVQPDIMTGGKKMACFGPHGTDWMVIDPPKNVGNSS